MVSSDPPLCEALCQVRGRDGSLAPRHRVPFANATNRQSDKFTYGRHQAFEEFDVQYVRRR